MSHADIIDLLAGITSGDGRGNALSAIRDQRAQARENAQLSFEALLEPARPGTFTHAERYAVATFTARLHGFVAAAEFYGDLLSDEAPELGVAVESAAADAATTGPYGRYREPQLQSEGTDGVRWAADAAASAALGIRLTAALAHTHLLVFRPREARPEALRALVDAGWSADEIVSLSQLIAFLSFQLRVAWGLRALAANPAPSAPALSASSPAAEGA